MTIPLPDQTSLVVACILLALPHLWALVKPMINGHPVARPAFVPVASQPVQSVASVTDAQYLEALAVIRRRNEERTLAEIAKVLNLGPVS